MPSQTRRSHLILVFVTVLLLSALPTSAHVGPAAFPPPPATVLASDGTFVNKVRVDWSGVSGATYYKVLRRQPGSTAYYVIASHVTDSLYDDVTAPHNVTSDYRISSCNSTDCSPPGLPGDSGYPGLATPSNVQASDGTYVDRICLTWREVSGAFPYRIHMGTSPGSWFYTALTLAPGAGACLRSDSITPGVLYYFCVQALNDLDESGLSKFDSGYQKLAQPVNVRATDGAFCDKTRVNWRLVDGATSYKVRRGDSSVGYSQEWTVFGNAFDDTSGDPGTIYYYSVVACAGTGCGDPSTPDPGYRDRPPAPVWIAASQGTYHNMVHVSWAAVPGASSYALYQGVFDVTYVFYLLSSDITTTSYDSYNALPDTTHYYYVLACNACGCGPPSGWAEGWRLPSTPTPTPTSTLVPTGTPTATRLPNTPTPTRASGRTYLPMILRVP